MSSTSTNSDYTRTGCLRCSRDIYVQNWELRTYGHLSARQTTRLHCQACEKRERRNGLLTALALFVSIPAVIFGFLYWTANQTPPSSEPQRALTEEEQSWSDYLEEEEYRFMSPGDFGP